MEKIAYSFSKDFNINITDITVMETRSIKRNIEKDESKSVQLLKADMQTYPITDIDAQIIEKLGAKPFLVLSDEISSEQFESFMDVSCDLLSVDMSKLNLH